MRAIRKTFPGVVALDHVDLAVRAGTIHALVGENGAGKSTLMKVLSGVYPHGSFDGSIVFDGERLQLDGIHDSEARGIIIIHQELALVPTLTVAENIFLGNEIATRGVIDRVATVRQTRALLDRVGLAVTPDTPVSAFGVGQQQLVEIAKALSKRVRLLILDEPTASLNERDSAALLELLAGLRAEGIACILISHKLNEIARVADAVTILRDGRTVETFDCAGGVLDENRVIRGMVGRSLTDRYPPRSPRIGALGFAVSGWSAEHPDRPGVPFLDDLALEVRRGEVVGIAGLMGAGRTEFAMSLFGRSWGRQVRGTATLDGRPLDCSTVARAIAGGLAYVTEDRKAAGLVLDQSIRFNTSLARLGGVSEHGVIDRGREHAVAERYRRALGIRSSGVEQPAVHLSGGNQQKVVIAKWLFTEPQVLILDEPTRGIDVGAKYEIYALIAGLAAEGRCVIVISSELPELLGITDRIVVMNEGRFITSMPTPEATQEKIMGAILRAQARRVGRLSLAEALA